MPIALLIIGILIVIAGVKNNASLLETTLVSDFTGAGSFWYWIAAVLLVGSVGYYQPAKNVSHLFLGLIVLVFLLSNGGVFAQLQSSVANPAPAKGNTDGGTSAPASNDNGKGATGSSVLTGDPLGLNNIGPSIAAPSLNDTMKAINGFLGGML